MSFEAKMQRSDIASERATIASYDATRSDRGTVDRLLSLDKDHEHMYVPDVDWFHWTGNGWAPDTDDARIYGTIQVEGSNRYRQEAMEAHKLAAQLDNAGASDDDIDAVKAMAVRLEKFALQLENNRQNQAALTTARKHQRFITAVEDLDPDPDLLNTPSGTIHLPTGELRPHDPADKITKLTSVPYDPEATCPEFLANLERFQPDAEIRAYLQREAGAAATGHRSRDLIYHFGYGGNWKSMFEDSVMQALGDYGLMLDPDALVAKRGGVKSAGDKSELFDLRGVRFAAASEPEKGQSLAEGLVKWLTNQKIKAKKMRRDHVEFESRVNIWFSANYKLKVNGTDDGIWDRMKMVEWGVRIAPEERDKRFFEKVLVPELPGILTWIVQGAVEYYVRGCNTEPPEQVRISTEQYREEMDTLAQFIATECSFDSEAATTSAAFWSAVESFGRNERLRLSNADKSDWKHRLEQHYDVHESPNAVRQDDGSRQRVFTGIRLNATPEPYIG